MMNGVDVEKVPPQEAKEKIQVYSIRWLVLGIFVAYSASNAVQWIQFSIISDVVEKYYQISSTFVDWTSMIYMVLYIPFVFPASYLLEKLGLRKSVLLGMLLTCIGAWIKLISVKYPFWIAFLGQSIVAFAQVFVLSVPARLAAVWFGPSQVSSACSIGVFGNQLGIALGFLIPPMIVDNKSTHEEQTNQFYVMYGIFAGYATVLFIIIIMFFKDAPPTPPSHAALQQSTEESVDFIQSLKNLILNKSYMLLLFAYGINVGVFYAISTLLNQIILFYYGESAAVDAGRIGLVMVLTGMLGSVVCGIILDKYHKYKETTLVVYAAALLSMVLYTFTLSKGIYVVYLISSLLGFFMTGLLPVGFELAAELTYPEPEGTSTGMLNMASQVFGFSFTILYSYLFKNVGDVWANLCMCIMLLLGTILLVLTSSDLRRQAALAQSSQ